MLINIINYITDYIKREFYSFIIRRRNKKLLSFFDNYFEDFVKRNSIPELSPAVADQIKNFWKKYTKYEIGLNYHRIAALKIPEEKLKFIVSDSVFNTFIIKKLNPENRSFGLTDKGLYNVFFSGVSRPNDIVRNVRGVFLDERNKIIDRFIAIQKVLQQRNPVVFKKSIDSYGGKNIKIVDVKDCNLINQTFELFREDFVVQEFLVQSKQTAMFNPTSLNTFRVLTLLLNGKFSLLGAWLRCGTNGSVVDNLTSGGMAACVFPDGKMSYGINLDVPKIERSPTGLKYEDCQIEHFDRIVKLAEELHRRIPSMSMVGWDFALDTSDEPVFIEANLLRPDTLPWQMTQGPIFGDRLQEVLDFCFPDIK